MGFVQSKITSNQKTPSKAPPPRGNTLKKALESATACNASSASFWETQEDTRTNTKRSWEIESSDSQHQSVHPVRGQTSQFQIFQNSPKKVLSCLTELESIYRPCVHHQYLCSSFLPLFRCYPYLWVSIHLVTFGGRKKGHWNSRENSFEPKTEAKSTEAAN